MDEVKPPKEWFVIIHRGSLLLVIASIATYGLTQSDPDDPMRKGIEGCIRKYEEGQKAGESR